MFFNCFIRRDAIKKSAIVSCLALSLWHSAAQAAQFKGSVEQSTSFIRPARFHCNCSAHPLKHVAGPLAPNNLGGELDKSGRIIGQMDCGTGKHVYLEFGDLEQGKDPAWTAWLRRLKDCLEPIWASQNLLYCEFNLTALVTPDGHIKQIEKCNYSGYTGPGKSLPEEPVLTDAEGGWFAAQLIAVNDLLSTDGDDVLRFPLKRNQDTKIYIWFQNKFTSP